MRIADLEEGTDMPLETEINAYEQMRDELERLYKGKFVVIHGNEFVGAFDDLDSAAKEAIRQFGSGPYLIRQVGSPSITAPILITTFG